MVRRTSGGTGSVVLGALFFAFLLLLTAAVAGCRSGFDRGLVELVSVNCSQSEVRAGERAVPLRLHVVNHTNKEVTIVRAELDFSLAEGFLERPDLEPRMPAIAARGSGTVVLVMDVPQRAQPEVKVDGKIWALSLEDGELYVDRQADSPLLLRVSTNSGVSPQHLDLVVTVATDEQDGDNSMSTVEEAGGLDDVSLREAIRLANNRPGPDTIGFSEIIFPESSVQNILVGSVDNTPLPAISDAGTEIVALGRGVQLVPVDGASNDVDYYNAALRVEAVDSAVRGVRIADFEKGIYVTSGSVTIEQNSIRCTDGVGISAMGANIIVADNQVTSGSLTMELCSDSLVTRNTIFGGSGRSIALVESDHITVTDNLITNGYIGLGLIGDDNEIVNNQIDFNRVNVLVYPSAIGNLIAENSITSANYSSGSYCSDYSCGVGVHLNGGMQNRLSRNRITGSEREGILLTVGANNDLAPPEITKVSPASIAGRATAEDGSVVEVFADPEDEGEQYLGSVTLSGGQWELFITVPTELNLTATITDLQGNTSAFSTPPPAP